jgi:hypothetical protein
LFDPTFPIASVVFDPNGNVTQKRKEDEDDKVAQKLRKMERTNFFSFYVEHVVTTNNGRIK